jgi:protein-tyrosine kinase
MSKFFEALNRRKGESVPWILPELNAASAEQSRDTTLEDMDGLLDKPEGDLAGTHSPSPAPIENHNVEEQTSGFQPRTLPLKISVRSPLLPFEANWRAGEQYRILRTKLVHHPLHPRMILVSSAGSGDGKSVTAINLAGALALRGDAKVLLVDGDFRRSSVHNLLGLPSGPGLSDVLVGDCSLESALIHTEQLANLYVMTAGEARVNPVELLDSGYWVDVCRQLRKLFSYIIVDSPPIGAVADSELLHSVCDGVLVVVRPDHTGRASCTRALETLRDGKLLGVVVNCVEDWFLSRDQGYGSCEYYSEYSGPTAR